MSTCPSCQQIDLVRKVRSIVSDGTVEGQTEIHSSGLGLSSNYQQKVGIGIGINTVSSSSSVTEHKMSLLARRLLPPDKPTPPNPPESRFSIPILIFFFPLYIFIALLVYLDDEMPRANKKFIFWGAVIGTLLPISSLIIIPNTNIRFDTAWQAVLFLILVTVPGVLVSLIFYNNGMVAIKKKEDVKYQADLRKYQRETLIKYQEGLVRWNDLYYCSRCDVVFLQKEPQFVAPERLSEVIFKTS
jgi:hypothetical protein